MIEKRKKIYLAFLEDCRNAPGKTVGDIIELGYRLLRQARLHPHFFRNNSLLETARYLTFFSLQLSPESDHAHYLQLKLTEGSAAKILTLFEKRIADRIPVEYLTHEAWYEGRKFIVNQHVLVPRSMMSTRFSDFLRATHWKNFRVLDLCTGSGCIGITLALLHPKITVDLVDISEQALAIAAINVNQYGLSERVKCIQSDLFDQVQQKYDLIISNPPYVSTAEYRGVQPEFKHEPKLALEAGWDGLSIIHKILGQAKDYLNPQGKVILEVGCTAAKRLKRRYRHAPFQWLKYRHQTGKIPILSMDCILISEMNGLLWVLSQKRDKPESIPSQYMDKIKDLF